MSLNDQYRTPPTHLLDDATIELHVTKPDDLDPDLLNYYEAAATYALAHTLRNARQELERRLGGMDHHIHIVIEQ